MIGAGGKVAGSLMDVAGLDWGWCWDAVLALEPAVMAGQKYSVAMRNLAAEFEAWAPLLNAMVAGDVAAVASLTGELRTLDLGLLVGEARELEVAAVREDCLPAVQALINAIRLEAGDRVSLMIAAVNRTGRQAASEFEETSRLFTRNVSKNRRAMFSTEEVSHLLGLERKSVLRLVRAGKVPPSETVFGRSFWFSRDLDEYFARKRGYGPTPDEVVAENRARRAIEGG